MRKKKISSTYKIVIKNYYFKKRIRLMNCMNTIEIRRKKMPFVFSYRKNKNKCHNQKVVL